MALFEAKTVKILGTGSYVPEHVMTNADLEKMVDTNDEWIIRRTGIRERRIIAPDQQTADMAYEASIKALEDAGLGADELDMVIVGTNSPEELYPGVAFKVQDKLAASGAGAFDLQAGCPGGVFALGVGAAGVASGLWKNVLVVGADANSHNVDWTDRNTCVLFGDGAGACILGGAGASRDKGTVVAADMKADGSAGEMIRLEDFKRIVMQGNDVFKFVNRMIPDHLTRFCADSGINVADVDHWILHQANMRIVEGILRRLDVPMSRAVINLDKYGNTSSASVMIGLDEVYREGRVHERQKLVLSSFGAGMAYGSVLIAA